MISRKLSEVAPPSPSRTKPAPNEIVWHLTLDQITSGSGRIDHRVYGHASEAASSSFAFDEGNVLYSKLRPYLNKVICPDTNGVATTELVPLRPNPDELNREYLCFYLRSPKFVSWASAQVDGAKMPRMKMKSFWAHEIPIPPLDDQIRIAHLLGKVEGLIAQRKQHLQQLDDLLKSVFLEMFGDPVRNEKGWDAVPFHKVGQFTSGGTPSKSRDDYWIGNFPWVSPKDMKVSKIGDAEDHISEAVFEETSLKRINPGHLLIVVRGMILAHSFPVAINTVEIAINQDMKAIKPTKGINVIYLQNCLVSLKRQILKLISTAGHGTRKFDSIAMQKLFIPKPPESLQNQFAAIVEKFESIKSNYQQSLTDLEVLYGALSQQAFKGELDLSRVPLPDEQGQPMRAEHDEQQEQADRSPLLVGTITPTEVINRLVQAATPQGRSELLARWLRQYLTNTSPDASLGSAQLLESAWQTLQESQLETDEETPALTLDDYDALKNLVFKALASGELNQTFDGDGNRVALQKRPANWGTW